MFRRIAYAVVVSAAAAVPAAAQGPSDPMPPAAAAGQPLTKLRNDSLQVARQFVAWLWSSQVDSIIAHSPRDTTTTRQQMIDQLAQMVSQIGVEQEVVEEKWIRRNGRRQYWRTARFSDFTQEPVVLRIVILPDGRMAGLGLNPLSRVPEVEPEVP